MSRRLDHPIQGHREHSMGTVVPMFSKRRTVAMFDQDDPRAHQADRCVLLTCVEAQNIAQLINILRRHAPSPRSCDEAIALLCPPKRSA